MNHILRPLPFVLASTNIGTMILNHCDRHTHANNPIKNGGGGAKMRKIQKKAMQIKQVLA